MADSQSIFLTAVEVEEKQAIFKEFFENEIDMAIPAKPLTKEDTQKQLNQVMLTIGFLTLEDELGNALELAELKTMGRALKSKIHNWDWKEGIQVA